ncbi:DUF397 domain-containing protein [Streptomyces griseoincarnatus]
MAGALGAAGDAVAVGGTGRGAGSGGGGAVGVQRGVNAHCSAQSTSWSLCRPHSQPEDASIQPCSELRWRTSSYSSGAGGECVEVALNALAAHVRDSKCVAQGGPVLRVGSAAWSALLGVV